MGYLRLKDGDTVAVLGGGPAGSFFAIHVRDLARKHGIGLNVAIIERKSFAAHGPTGCNMCAGVLGGNIVNMISGLDLHWDNRVIRQNVEGFRLDINGHGALIRRPLSKIYTVFRGMGPRSEALSEGSLGFDSFLLEEAKKTGAVVVNGTITDVMLPNHSAFDKCTVRYTDEANKPQELEAALLVGAFGVNSNLSSKFRYGYAEPRYWHTCQTELLAAPGSDFSRYINIFSRKGSRFLFTAVIPKGRYLTVSGIGRHVRFSDLIDELRIIAPGLMAKTGNEPAPVPLCHCHPRLPVTAAVRPFHTRVVMIGDASVSRYMKNGIESAFITSKWAAETALTRGIDEAAFRDSYYHGCVETFARDNRFGRVMFFMHRVVTYSRRMNATVISIIRNESGLPVEKQWMSNISWHMFIGDKPYRSIVRIVLNIAGMIRFLLMTAGIKRVTHEN